MWRMKQQDEKMMKFGNKKKLTWDMPWNMKPIVIITVHLETDIVREKSLHKLLFRKSTSNFIIPFFQCSRSTTMRFKHSIPRQPVYIKSCQDWNV